MSHAVDDFQSCAADMLRRVPTGGDRYERIAGAVDHQRGRRHACERGATIAGGQDRAQLTRRPFRIEPAPRDPFEVRTQDCRILQEPWTADDAEQEHQVVDDPVDVGGIVRWPTQQGPQCARLAQGDLRPRIPGR